MRAVPIDYIFFPIISFKQGVDSNGFSFHCNQLMIQINKNSAFFSTCSIWNYLYEIYFRAPKDSFIQKKE